MNLYIFNESSRANVYGIGTYICELTNALRHSELNFCVVNLKQDIPKIRMEAIDGINHWSFPKPALKTTDEVRQSERYYRNIAYLLDLHIKDRKGLIFHLNYSHSGKLAEELKKAFECRILAVIHYFDWALMINGNLKQLQAILQKKHPNDFELSLRQSMEDERNLYSKADRVVCLSKYAYEIIKRDYGLDAAKIAIIPNGLKGAMNMPGNRNLLRKKWNISFKEKVILFVGRMDEIKGLIYLIRAFGKLLPAFPKCRLVIAGDGAYNIFAKESQDVCTRVTYTGLLDRHRLYEWYRLADVGVIPSLFEPFGYVALEMMMFGLPVISAATSGLNEVVDDTCGLKTQVVTTSEKVEIDVTVLAEKMLYLLQHPQQARQMGRNGRKRYLKEYTSETFCRNMFDLYKSVAES